MLLQLHNERKQKYIFCLSTVFFCQTKFFFVVCPNNVPKNVQHRNKNKNKRNEKETDKKLINFGKSWFGKTFCSIIHYQLYFTERCLKESFDIYIIGNAFKNVFEVCFPYAVSI